jgi:hypothetical protein
MQPSQPPDESLNAVRADIRARVMPAVLDELVRWGVERFSVEAVGSATTSIRRWSTVTGAIAND